MKKSAFCLTVLGGMMAASASDVIVPAGGIVTNYVAAGESSVQDGRVIVSSAGQLKKTGGGAWTVPSDAVAQRWPMALEVVNGAVSFPQDATAPENAVPSVMDQAAFWVSTKDTNATHLTQMGDKVSAWYDVRETDISNRRYISACVTNGTDLATRVTTNGVDCLYFGGVGSNIAMHFIAPGSTANVRVQAYNLFAVTGWYKTSGAVFGSGSSSGNLFMFQILKDLNGSLADPSRLWASTKRGSTYIDGVLCDPYVDTPPVGFHLFDSASQIVPVDAVTGSFFAQWGKSSGYWGGDYLAEAVVFTNRLSETERVAVASYLSKKWFGTSVARKDVTLGDATSLVVDTTGRDAQVRDLAVSGNGTVVQKGDNVAYYRSAKALPDRANGFNGKLTVEADAVDLSTRLPIERTTGGRIETSVSEAGAVRVSFAEGAANQLVKAGTGTVAVAGIATGIDKLQVDDGTLEISSVRCASDASEDDDEVYIENPSFEAFKEDADAVADKYYYAMPGGADYYKGWKRINNAAYFFDYPKTNLRAGYALNYPPLDGDCAVALHQNGSLFTPITITKKGLYEVSFDCTSKGGNTGLGHYLTCSIVDEGNNKAVVTTFGRAYCYEETYRRVVLRAEVNSVGNAFALKFLCDNYTVDMKSPPTPSAMIIDNVKLRRVHDWETGRWDVPHGDFEVVGEPALLATAKVAIVESPYDNWTFDQGQGRVELATMATTNSDWGAGFGCCSERVRQDDFRQLLMSRGACSATVTCTPPAGTYYLRSDLGRFYQYTGRLTATAKVGAAAAVELGALDIANSMMRTYTWPKAFAVSGAETVSVTFSFARKQSQNSANTGVWVDDVRLVTYDDREFIAKGGFEVGTDGDNWAVDTWEKLLGDANGTAAIQPYTYKPEVFSSDNLEGKMSLYIERTGGAAQPVTFDRPGLYRLSFYAAITGRSYSHGWYRNCSPVRAWLADGAGVTNVIGNTGTIANTNFCQYVWNFRVARPGTYTFGIQGTSTGVHGQEVRNDCSVIDAVSLRHIDESRFAGPAAVVLPEDLEVKVAAGARLRLDYVGTNAVHKVRLGGKIKHPGIVDATTDPDFICGTGALRIDSMDGAVIIVR